MPVSTFTQPDYPVNLGTTYPSNIDAAINVLAQMGQDAAPHAASTPNLTVLIDALKIIKADGTLVSVAQQTATFVAPVTNPRIDRIVIDALTGIYSIIAGTEAASPTAPAITAGKLPCAQVALSVGITQITNALITDERTAFVNYDARYAPTLATPQTASGTSIDFTGIPSWVKKITICFTGVSTNGTSHIWIQVGDSGGVETTGYLGAGVILGGGVVDQANYGGGFGFPAANAANIVHGSVTLCLADSSNNTWVASGNLALSNTAYVLSVAGSKATSAALDRVRITTVSGADTFDAGTLSIIYE